MPKLILKQKQANILLGDLKGEGFTDKSFLLQEQLKAPRENRVEFVSRSTSTPRNILLKKGETNYPLLVLENSYRRDLIQEHF